jgi:hypothetical protein
MGRTMFVKVSAADNALDPFPDNHRLRRLVQLIIHTVSGRFRHPAARRHRHRRPFVPIA